MTSLADIRAKLQKLENRKSGTTTNSGDGTTYPFWNINPDESTTVRFLPDGNPDNTFFWVERQVIKLPFPGIKGQDEDKEVTVQVPCVEMWNDTCPVHAEIRPWFEDPSLEDMARKYWKKRTYFFQGFVQDSPLNEDAPENPIRKFNISPQLFKIIKAALMDPDMEELPTDYLNGVDFKIVKTKDGQYANYTTSNYSRKNTALTEEQLEAIDEYGLQNLSDYLPKRPTEEEVDIIFEMFQASLEGELYDPERWAKYFRPWGLEYNDDSAKTESKPAPAPKAEVKAETPVAEVKEEVVEEKEEETSTSSGDNQSVQDILALVKSRNK
jgi:hypothetical protein